MTVAGGLAHRDSIGVAECYGDGDVQWLTAGIGILHEEMWWHPQGRDCELYQLWVNSPRDAKTCQPETRVLKAVDLEIRASDGANETVLGGRLGDDTGLNAGPHRDDIRLSRLDLEPGATFTCDLPPDATALLYVRRGAVGVGDGAIVPRHNLAYTTRDADQLVLRNAHHSDRADVLLLCARPLRQPIAASGTWVVSDETELARADADYRAGKMGVPWAHTLTDEEWRAWLERYPPSL